MTMYDFVGARASGSGTSLTPAQSQERVECLLPCLKKTLGLRLRLALWQDRLMLQLLGFIIDCPDPMKLATFYSQVTGRAIMEGSGGDMAVITFGEVDLAFQRVDDYRPPRWPDGEHPKQYHLDFEVDEIEPEQRRVVKLGATLQQDFIGPEGYGWRIFTDPVGHPFCLCRHEGVTWTDKGMAWP